MSKNQMKSPYEVPFVTLDEVILNPAICIASADNEQFESVDGDDFVIF